MPPVFASTRSTRPNDRSSFIVHLRCIVFLANSVLSSLQQIVIIYRMNHLKPYCHYTVGTYQWHSPLHHTISPCHYWCTKVTNYVLYRLHNSTVIIDAHVLHGLDILYSQRTPVCVYLIIESLKPGLLSAKMAIKITSLVHLSTPIAIFAISYMTTICSGFALILAFYHLN